MGAWFGGETGERKQTHDPTLLSTYKKLDVAIHRAIGLRGHDFYVKDEGTHQRVCDRSKCGRCGWKGHLRQECTLEVEMCHHFQQPGYIRVNFPRLVLRIHYRCLCGKGEQNPKMLRVCIVFFTFMI